jgi:hypothetical protein
VTCSPEEAAIPFSAPRPVVSGRRYPVVRVAQQGPSALADFIGSTDFEVDLDGSPYTVYGVGRQFDCVVRFHQKDQAGAGKDVRVWSIRALDPGPGFSAEHAPTG